MTKYTGHPAAYRELHPHTQPYPHELTEQRLKRELPGVPRRAAEGKEGQLRRGNTGGAVVLLLLFFLAKKRAV